MQKVRSFIAGESTEGAGREIPLLNPANEQQIATLHAFAFNVAENRPPNASKEHTT